LTVPGELLLPVCLIVLALSFDLFQYCIGTVTWFFFYQTKEMGSGRLCDILVQCRLQIDGINGEHFHVLLAGNKDHSRETVIHGK
jgi:hypothetical protein